MPKMIISIDGVVIKEVQLTKDRTTVGRRPYNDIVIDNLAVSGEHAVITRTPRGWSLEDQGSTNGTYLNGRPVRRETLQHQDTIDIGRYQLRFLEDPPRLDLEKTMMVRAPVGAADSPAPEPAAACLRVHSGAAAGREIALLKVVTTIGRPGQAVASITRRAGVYAIAHLDGDPPGCVNGVALSREPLVLQPGDRLELGGVEMEFLAR